MYADDEYKALVLEYANKLRKQANILSERICQEGFDDALKALDIENLPEVVRTFKDVPSGTALTLTGLTIVVIRYRFKWTVSTSANKPKDFESFEEVYDYLAKERGLSVTTLAKWNRVQLWGSDA